MKIFSVALFAAAMVWSWELIHSASIVSLDTHSGIQERMSSLIEKTILAKKPTAENIKVIKLWTENMTDNKVKAIFTYKFTEKTTENLPIENEISGEAVLHREPSNQTNVDQWVLQSVRTTNDTLEFSEGTVLTPTPGPDETEGEPAASPAHGK